MMEYIIVFVGAVCDCHTQVEMIFSGSRIGCRFIFFDQDCPECTASALLKAISFVIYKREMQQREIYVGGQLLCQSPSCGDAEMMRLLLLLLPSAAPAAAAATAAAPAAAQMMRLLLLHPPLLLLLPFFLK